jgi:hypothetical protein
MPHLARRFAAQCSRQRGRDWPGGAARYRGGSRFLSHSCYSFSVLPFLAIRQFIPFRVEILASTVEYETFCGLSMNCGSAYLLIFDAAIGIYVHKRVAAVL